MGTTKTLCRYEDDILERSRRYSADTKTKVHGNSEDTLQILRRHFRGTSEILRRCLADTSDILCYFKADFDSSYARHRKAKVEFNHALTDIIDGLPANSYHRKIVL
jgi:hypothetical protein